MSVIVDMLYHVLTILVIGLCTGVNALTDEVKLDLAEVMVQACPGASICGVHDGFSNNTKESQSCCIGKKFCSFPCSFPYYYLPFFSSF